MCMALDADGAGDSSAAAEAERPLPPSTDGAEEGGRAARLPRWTRQEILVLIQGKRVAESKARRVRSGGASEPKWAAVSSYCRMHGVMRGPVQCRKRWSNLAGDFKKIKDWQGSDKESSESFWSMRNDLRRQRKLPGFFDKEVYDILDGAQLAPPEEDGAPMFDSRRGPSADDGMFSDFDNGDAAPPPPPPPTPAVPISVAGNEKREGSNTEKGGTSAVEGRKRRRSEDEEGEEEEEEEEERGSVIEMLERSGKALASHLEAHNANMELDRQHRISHSDSLLAVLNKLADALVRISDKL